VLWAAVKPFQGPAFEPLIRRRARGAASFAGKDPFQNIPLPSPCGKREREETEKGYEFEKSWRTFFDAAFMAEVKRRLLLPPAVSLALPRS
jgi:hypothetical protein